MDCETAPIMPRAYIGAVHFDMGDFLIFRPKVLTNLLEHVILKMAMQLTEVGRTTWSMTLVMPTVWAVVRAVGCFFVH